MVFVVGVAAASGGWALVALPCGVVRAAEHGVGGGWMVVAVLGVGLSAVFSVTVTRCKSAFTGTVIFFVCGPLTACRQAGRAFTR